MSSTDNPTPLPPESAFPEPAGTLTPSLPAEIARPIETPAWSLLDVVRIAALTLVVLTAFNLAALWIASRGFVGHFSPGDLAKNPRIVVAAQLATYLLVLAYMVILVRQRKRTFWATIEWKWPPHWIAYPVLGVALSIFVSSASALLPIPKSLPIEEYFTDTTSAYLMALFGMTVAPLMEELFFRGFLFPALARKINIVLAIGITALLFALIHASQLAHAWAPLLLLFFVGVVLTGTRAKTGSVASSFLIHVGYNSTLFVMLFIATDHFRHMEKAM